MISPRSLHVFNYSAHFVSCNVILLVAQWYMYKQLQNDDLLRITSGQRKFSSSVMFIYILIQ